MLLAFVDLAAQQRPAADAVLGQHALDSQLHSQAGLLGHQGLVLGLLQTADVTGVGAIILVDQLVTGQHSLTSVDDDDVVTSVNMGGVLNLVLALQQGSGSGSHAAQGLTGGVQDVPFAFNGLVLGHESGLILFLHYS